MAPLAKSGIAKMSLTPIPSAAVTALRLALSAAVADAGNGTIVVCERRVPGTDRSQEDRAPRSKHGRVSEHLGVGRRDDGVFVAEVAGDVDGPNRAPEAQRLLERQVQLRPHRNRVRQKDEKVVRQQFIG